MYIVPLTLPPHSSFTKFQSVIQNVIIHADAVIL